MSRNRIRPGDNCLVEVWSPSDFEQAVRDAQAVVAAGRSGRHLTPVADGERTLRFRQHLTSQSRHRTARIYDFLAVLLMLATMAALGAALVLLSAPNAHADETAADYAGGHATQICQLLDEYPTTNGILGLIDAIVSDGLTAGQAGGAIAYSVAAICPTHEPVLEAFIAQYGTPGQVAV